MEKKMKYQREMKRRSQNKIKTNQRWKKINK